MEVAFERASLEVLEKLHGHLFRTMQKKLLHADRGSHYTTSELTSNPKSAKKYYVDYNQ